MQHVLVVCFLCRLFLHRIRSFGNGISYYERGGFFFGRGVLLWFFLFSKLESL